MNRKKIKQHLPPTQTFFLRPASFLYSQFFHPNLQAAQKWRTGGCGHGQSRAALLCQSVLLTLFPCFNVGPSEGLHSRSICSHVGSPEDAVLQEISICSTVALHRLQSLCSSTWSTSFPPPSSTMMSQGCSSHFFPHSSLPQSVFPFLKYVFPEALPAWLGLSCAMLESAGGTWNCSCPSWLSHSLSS